MTSFFTFSLPAASAMRDRVRQDTGEIRGGAAVGVTEVEEAVDDVPEEGRGKELECTGLILLTDRRLARLRLT
jgi:hypothetical protein